MNQIHHRVAGVADFRPNGGNLALFDSDGGLVATRRISLPDDVPSDQSRLLELASQFLKTTPWLCHLAVIVRTSQLKNPAVERIAIDPVPVSIVPEVLAAAHAVPGSWRNFQIIDYCSRIWWLVEKKDQEVFGMRSAPFSRLSGAPHLVMAQFAAVGFANAAALGEEDLPDAVRLESNALLWGANRAWQQLAGTEGVHVGLNRKGSETLELDTVRRIRYGIVHADQPVFSLQEDSLCEMSGQRPVMFVVDERVNAIYGGQLDIYAAERLKCAGKIVISGSEARKVWPQVDWVCRELARVAFPRHGVLISVGGGVALDVAGFAASVFRRGIPYVRVPTSLIGQVDAGLGVKQGVNFAEKKNLLGAFYAPLGTINDPSFLTTLSFQDLSCGIAEIIKIALVKESPLFELLEDVGREILDSRFARPKEAISRILRMAQILMLEELQQNLYETEHARLADFGHSFGPEIEMQSAYSIPHGLAVAYDMLLSAAIAVDRGLCTQELLCRIARLYRQVQLPVGPVPCSAERLLHALDTSRRHRGGHLNLVVPSSVGAAVFLQDVQLGDIEQATARLKNLQDRNSGVANVSVGL